ncbi:MAG: cell division protein FtsZ [Alphaproteobacteria bacterium]|nr:cell division protein FtsZ [Alphaproteobacteria bacterium]
MINLTVPAKQDLLRPTITVIGVGGAGGNAVNNMISAQLEGVNFVVANTDAQAVDYSLTDRTIQLGANITRGLGAGANPDIGRASAEEAKEEIAAHIEGSNMVFITAGMGGGTGTGAAPVVARIAKDMGMLTVAVVTKPFQFEGAHRMRLAEAGLRELQDYVDTLIVIPNQNLFRLANEKTTFSDAFRMADEVLHSGVRGVTDLMVKPGMINLDFADIRTVMREMGKAMMGTGEASGERRAIDSAEAAISNPLLDDVSLKGARSLLVNITGGMDMTLFEVDEAMNRIREEVDSEANIIFGSTFNDAMEGKMRVSVVATGIDVQKQSAPAAAPKMVATETKKPFNFAPVAPAKPEFRPATVSPRAEVSRQFFTPVEQPRSAPAYMEEESEQQPAPVAAEASQPVFTAREPASAAPLLSEPRFMPAGALGNRPAQESNEDDDSGEQGRGFFSRVADVGRVLSSRANRSEVAERIQVVQKPMVQEKSQPIHSEDEQYLDIPAFLRRQAN